MRHPNLRAFLNTLKREKELHVIDEPIDPRLELAEIQRRVVAQHGPALLFTRVTGTQFPVATNLFGTCRRIDLAFGEEPARFFKRVVEAAETLMPPSVSKLWSFRDLAGTAIRLGRTSRRTGPVLERVIEPPRLTSLPQIQNWPQDGGPFITLPLVYTEHPATGKGNLGMYRNQIYDDRTAGMHFQIHRGGGFHYHEAEAQNRPLPVNLFLGGPPALIMSAVAPLPENVPELILASLLQDGRLAQVVDPGISTLPIVAEADFLLAGQIPPKVRRLEGPFGDHYGYYSLAHEFPVFEVHRLYHRRDAVFPATVVGRPRQEDHYIGEYLQELFAPVFPLVMNGVVDVWAYDDAGVHPLASAVVRERYRREAFMAAMRILGEGQLSLTKFLIVTDARLELKRFRSLLVHVLERADFATDLFIFSNVSQDTLDYTTRTLNQGSKAILLGLGEKKFQLQETPQAMLRESVFHRQAVFAPGVLVVQGPPWREGDTAVEDLLQESAVRPFRLVILVDDAADCVRDEASFLWTVFTRLEPAADIYAHQSRLVRYHVSMSAPVVFDCRIKAWFPPLVEPLPDTVRTVDALWPKIFPDGPSH
jgi:4-hydroxybenzoate decarboxylase subunit C